MAADWLARGIQDLDAAAWVLNDMPAERTQVLDARAAVYRLMDALRKAAT